MNQMTLTDAINLSLACPAVTLSFEGSPGVGKTFKSAARLREAGYNTRIIPCQNLIAEDMGMLPCANKDGTVTFMPNAMWRPVPGVKYAVILDELFKAPEDVVNGFNGLLFGKPRMMQGFVYPDDTIVIVTSNPAMFGAGDRLRPHHVNRLVNLHISDPTVMEAQQDMLDLGFDPRLIDWVTSTPSALVSYDPDMQKRPQGEMTHYFGYQERAPRQPFCSMRSLEMVSKLMQAPVPAASLLPAIAATIGGAAALSLTARMAQSGEYVPVAEMLADPKTARVPKLLFDHRIAGLTAAAGLTRDNWKLLFQYAKRLNVDVYRSVFLEALQRRTSHAEMTLMGAYNREFLTAFGDAA